MDTCPTEVVTLIVECACSSDFGQTARSIGLVSKFFQAIAKPIELRIIAVAGLKQLQSAIERIRSLKVSHSSEVVDVRHLFICELRSKHTIAVDSEFRNSTDDYVPRSSFCRTRHGVRGDVTDSCNSDKFWYLAGALVRNASPNLQTLSLLTPVDWVTPRRSISRPNPKVLSVLSGVAFPNLISLTVNHDVTTEFVCFGAHRTSFRSPITPSLRRLYIRSPILLSRMNEREQDTPEAIHPLLVNVKREESKITHLIICEDSMWAAERAMKIIFGVEWRAQLQNETLPGELQSIILERAIVPGSGCGTVFHNYQLATQLPAQQFGNTDANGLEAHLLAAAWKMECESLLSKWKEQILAIHK